MSKRNIILLAGAGLLVLAILAYQIPAINSRLSWRFEVARTYVRNVINPVGSVPTAIPSTPQANGHRKPNGCPVTPAAANCHSSSRPRQHWHHLRRRRSSIRLRYEKQTANNCGPAALSMMLHLFGWTGDQKTISDVIKPVNGDRNVNPEEMAYWVRNYAGWLRIEYRVGGDRGDEGVIGEGEVGPGAAGQRLPGHGDDHLRAPVGADHAEADPRALSGRRSRHQRLPSQGGTTGQTQLLLVGVRRPADENRDRDADDGHHGHERVPERRARRRRSGSGSPFARAVRM